MFHTINRGAGRMELSAKPEACASFAQGLTAFDFDQDGDSWFLYDANGNVGQILKYVAGETPTVNRVAHYEYDPYGNAITVNNNTYETDGTLLSQDTGYALASPIRFSTKVTW